jgi:hypothetical protein
VCSRFLFGKAIGLLLIVSLFVFFILHARTGSGLTMAMDGSGGGEQGDFVEIDAAPSLLLAGSSLPTNNRAILTFYLLGIVLWSFAATIVVI